MYVQLVSRLSSKNKLLYYSRFQVQVTKYTACESKQELSCRKQIEIAHQLRTQYVEGINSNPVTLKSRLRDAHALSLETERLDRSYTTYH